MPLRLYRTTLAAAPRLFNEFDIPYIGNMVNRGVRSIGDRDSANSDINVRFGFFFCFLLSFFSLFFFCLLLLVLLDGKVDYFFVF